MYASAEKRLQVWSKDTHFPDINFIEMDIRFLLVFLIIGWLVMMIFYGQDTSDKEWIFAQFKALSIPSPRAIDPPTLFDDVQSMLLVDPQYVHEYGPRAQ